jgi:hypothetical protein
MKQPPKGRGVDRNDLVRLGKQYPELAFHHNIAAADCKRGSDASFVHGIVEQLSPIVRCQSGFATVRGISNGGQLLYILAHPTDSVNGYY